MLEHALVLEHAAVGIFATDRAGECTYVNRRWREMSGQTSAQAMGSGWIDAIHVDDRQRVAADWREAAGAGNPYSTECRYHRPDGSDVWIRVAATAVREGEAVTGYVATITDITERRRGDASWQHLFQAMPETMLVLQGGRISFANAHATKLLGYTTAELAGMDPTTLPQHDQDVVRERIRASALSPTALPWRKTRLRRKDGSLASVEATTVRAPYLGPDAAIAILRDLSEANRLAERMRAGVEGMPDAFAVLDAVRDADGRLADFRIAECNTLLEGIWGRRLSHLIGALVSEVAPDVLGACARAAELGAPVSLEVDRESHLLHGLVLPVPDGVAIIFRDVTERRQQQQELELRGVVIGNMADGVSVVRAADRQIIYANPSFCRMHGWQVGELDGEAFRVLRPADLGADELEQRQEIKRQVSAVGHWSGEVRNGRRDGSTITVQAKCSTMELPGHGLVWVSVLRDVTAEKRAREDLTRLAFLVDSSGDAIVALDPGGAVVTWNDAAGRLLGRPKEDVLGKPLDAVAPPDLAGDLMALLARAKAGERVEAWETSWRRPDGATPVLSLQISPVNDGRGAAVGVSLIARDVTARDEAERLVRESLAQKDVLLREIHHRVKNNLQVISSLFSLQSRRLADPAALAVLRESQARVRSIALLHERLYRTGDVARVVMSDYARSLAVEVLRACGSPERVRAEVETGTVSLALDAAVPCGLILNELITNAVKHAFPGERTGKVTVAFAQESDWIVLRVADDGAGLPAGAEPAASSTLGMHLIHTLADQLDGSATFRSDHGTACEVRFPAKEDRA